MWAYIFPDSKISVSREGRIRITGVLAPYQSRIAFFINELGLRDVTIRHRSGRFYFPRSLDARTRQRLRNFLLAECPPARG
jgi:hypothetical protein